MTGGLVATLEGSTTSTNNLQTRQTLSTNCIEHIRLPHVANAPLDVRLHRIKKEHPAKCVYCPDSNVAFDHSLLYCPLHDYTRTSHCQLNQMYTTLSPSRLFSIARSEKASFPIFGKLLLSSQCQRNIRPAHWKATFGPYHLRQYWRKFLKLLYSTGSTTL